MMRFVTSASAAIVVASVLAPLPSQARIKNDPAALVAANVPADQSAAESTGGDEQEPVKVASASDGAASGDTGEAQVVAATEIDPSAPVMPAPSDAAGSAEQETEATNEARAAKVGGARVGGGLEKLIATRAAEHGVPLALARAVITVESNFDPSVTGSAGEIGLMQIKPATARGIGYAGSSKALYDPDTNLRWGMKYLAGAYDLAGGDICGTIMRYQGGHYASHMTSASTSYCARVKRLMGRA